MNADLEVFTTEPLPSTSWCSEVGGPLTLRCCWWWACWPSSESPAAIVFFQRRFIFAGGLPFFTRLSCNKNRCRVSVSYLGLESSSARTLYIGICPQVYLYKYQRLIVIIFVNCMPMYSFIELVDEPEHWGVWMGDESEIKYRRMVEKVESIGTVMRRNCNRFKRYSGTSWLKIFDVKSRSTAFSITRWVVEMCVSTNRIAIRNLRRMFEMINSYYFFRY